MLDLPLRTLKIIGLHPANSSWIAQIKAAISIVVIVTVVITSIMEMCDVKWDIVSVTPEVEALMAALQVLLHLFFYNFQNCKMHLNVLNLV